MANALWPKNQNRIRILTNSTNTFAHIKIKVESGLKPTSACLLNTVSFDHAGLEGENELKHQNYRAGQEVLKTCPEFIKTR